MKPKEIRFLKSQSLCRLATASKNLMPHVIPVIYTLDGDEDIVIAVDYGTKKLKNLRENSKVALLVDDGKANKCIVIQGNCKIYEKGTEYLRLLNLLFERFEFYRNDPWGEGESPILKIKPEKIVSWGL